MPNERPTPVDELLRLVPYDGNFLHGVSLDDWFACWNISLTGGHLMSPDFMALVDAGLRDTHHSVRDADIETLRHSPQSVVGVPTPRGRDLVFIAAMYRLGLEVLDGYGVRIDVPHEERQQAILLGNAELAFEEVRREVARDAPSRLNCLYLADASRHGRSHINNMLAHRRLLIVDVAVPCALRAGRYDTKWFEEYVRTLDRTAIEQYWRGDAYPGQRPTWEHLIEGIVLLTDDQQIERIRTEGKALPGWPEGQSLPGGDSTLKSDRPAEGA